MNPNRIVLHCSSTPNGKHISASTIRSWHVKERGWSDIGYHLIINDSGSEKGRPTNKQGAGVLGENKNTLHICLIGDTKWTKRQFFILKQAIVGYQVCFGIKDDMIFGHYELDKHFGKTCPNFRISDFMLYFLTDNDGFIKKYFL